MDLIRPFPFILGSRAYDYSMKYYPGDLPTLDGEANRRRRNGWNNAFAHAVTSATMAYEWGVPLARTLGDAREWATTSQSYFRGNPAHVDPFVDLTNNDIGRQIGMWARQNGYAAEDLPYLVAQAAIEGLVPDSQNTGRLIVHPDDPRAPDDIAGEIVDDWRGAVPPGLVFGPLLPPVEYDPHPNQFSGFPSDYDPFAVWAPEDGCRRLLTGAMACPERTALTNTMCSKVRPYRHRADRR